MDTIATKVARIRERALEIPVSKIRDVSDSGIGNPDVIPLWFGESDQQTPDYIKQAAKEALEQGHTFYTENQGIPPLRDAIAAYLGELYGVAIDRERITVTTSGMSAIMIVMESIVEPGGNVIIHTPIWPNCRESVHIMSGDTRIVPLTMDERGWTLDLDEVFSKVDDRTRGYPDQFTQQSDRLDDEPGRPARDPRLLPGARDLDRPPTRSTTAWSTKDGTRRVFSNSPGQTTR